MPTLSDHTKLINLLISLAVRTPDLSHPLEDIGYTLDRIGMKVTFTNSLVLKTDVSYKSHAKNSLLIVEAKSGGVENEQAEKYKNLRPDDISRLGLTTLPAENLSLQVCYACLSKNKYKLLENEKRNHFGFPILVYENNTLLKEQSSGSFKDEELEVLFSTGVSFGENPPYTFYPFGPDDKRGWIAYQILFKLAEFRTKNKTYFTEIDLLQSCHPLIGWLDRDEYIKIRQVVHKVLDDLSQMSSPKLRIVPRKNQEWEIMTLSLTKALSKYFMEVAERYDPESPYAKLPEFGLNV